MAEPVVEAVAEHLALGRRAAGSGGRAPRRTRRRRDGLARRSTPARTMPAARVERLARLRRATRRSRDPASRPRTSGSCPRSRRSRRRAGRGRRRARRRSETGPEPWSCPSARLWAARHDRSSAAAAVRGEHLDRRRAEELARERLAVEHAPAVAGLGARQPLRDGQRPRLGGACRRADELAARSSVLRRRRSSKNRWSTVSSTPSARERVGVRSGNERGTTASRSPARERRAPTGSAASRRASTPSRIRSSSGKVSTGTISIVGSSRAIRSPSTLQTTASRAAVELDVAERVADRDAAPRAGAPSSEPCRRRSGRSASPEPYSSGSPSGAARARLPDGRRGDAETARIRCSFEATGAIESAAGGGLGCPDGAPRRIL